MKFLSLLFVLIAIPCIIFSQTASKKKAFSEHRMNVRKAANYFLRKKINPSPEFSVQYTSLYSGLQGYRKKDTLLAAKLIKRLYRVNDILFYRLMRIRLEWEFKQHLVRSPLDSIRPLLKNNIDSSKYYYMLGLYFQDSMNENLARSFGYVRSTYDGNEIVDWRKMKVLKWGNPKTIESFTGNVNRNFKAERIKDSSISCYKKAIDNDPTEFHYIKDFILFMSNLPEIKDEEIQQVKTSKLENYTDKEKNGLKNVLIAFIKGRKIKTNRLYASLRNGYLIRCRVSLPFKGNVFVNKLCKQNKFSGGQSIQIASVCHQQSL